MLVAALFLLGTRDFKRMLAYSSVEHMGILVHRRGTRRRGMWRRRYFMCGAMP